MNENINLCELLKGHEGETFYNPMFGNVKLLEVNPTSIYPIRFDFIFKDLYLSKEGKYYNDEECVVFPSKTQRDWNKWAEEQKPKVPKTWSECLTLDVSPTIGRYVRENGEYIFLSKSELKPIEKSALALLKIHQLIEVGYGGNITDEEWKNNWHSTIRVNVEGKLFTESTYNSTIFPIAFHTKEQAEEFLSYPENVQLLKDFYMV